MPASWLLRRALRAGLVGGVLVVYLGAVGMVEKFDVRNLVADVLTLGRLMLILPPVMAGFVATRPRIERGQVERAAPGPAALAAAGAGAVAGVVVVAFVLMVRAIGVDTVREFFISVTAGLLSILTFGRGLAAGSVVLVLGGAALGAAGAGLRLLPWRYRRPVLVGLVTTLLLALLQRIVPPLLFELGFTPDWLYSRIFGGLTYLGAAVVFVVAAAATWVWMRNSAEVRERVREAGPQARRSLYTVGLLALLLFLAVLPQLLGSVLSQILGTVGIFLLMGLGLNIVVGYAGLLDLGYVAFFAVGAYFLALTTGAVLVTSLGSADPAFSLHLNFYAGVVVVILIAAVIGLLIGAPVLRLRGDYLAIVTLGFGEIARVLVQSNWLKPLVGGPQGMRDITDAAILGFSFRDPQRFFYLVLAFCLLAAYVSWRLADSRIGRAWNAMREDEQVAEAMGISTIKYKLLAFAVGAGVGCLSGALFAVQIGSLNVRSFTVLVSITALAVVIAGGMGSIPGVVVGTLVLIGIPGLLSEFEEFKLLIYGAVLIAVMILRPQGLIPNVRRMRELHEEERAQDAWLRAAEAGAAAADGSISDPAPGEAAT